MDEEAVERLRANDRKDRELIRRARAGDSRAEERLVEKYTSHVRLIAASYYYPGGDWDDPAQEGFYGLTLAIRQFDLGAGSPFLSFARLVITRHVITGLKAATRGKHSFLSNSIRIAKNDDHEEVPVLDVLPSRNSDPHDLLVQSQKLAAILAGVTKLTEIERESIIGIANGVPYTRIIEKVGGNEKRVDNAAQRARRHLRRIPEAA